MADRADDRADMSDWLLSLDPGFQRLRSALRALLSIALAVGALYAARRVWPIPLAAMMLAAAVAMLGSQVAGAQRKSRLLTTTLLPLPLLFSAGVVALVAHDSTWVAYTILVGLVYVAAEARRFGSRGILLGMASVMGFFIACFIGMTLSQLGPIAAALVVSAGLTMLVRELIIPDAPRATLRWSVRAFRAQARRTARLLLAYLDIRNKARLRRRCATALDRVNVCALAVDAALNALKAGIADRHSDRRADKPADEGSHNRSDKPADNHRDKRRTAFAAALTDAELVVETCAAQILWQPEAPHREVRAVLTAIVDHRRGVAARLASRLPQPCAPNPPRPPHAIHKSAKNTLGASTRQALQAALARAAAIAAGQWLSPTRWYWALLAAFVVFAGTASAGETLQKIWARVLGTVLGVAAGIALVSLIGTDVIVNAALVVVLTFAGFYLQPVSYLAMTLCTTLALGLVYALVGQSTEGLLTLRLEETAIGAFFGGIVSMTFFPVRTGDVIDQTISAYLEALDDTIATSIDALLGADTKTPPQECSRALDGKLRGLITRSQPVLEPLPLLKPPQRQRDAINALRSCSYFARHLAQKPAR